jgi:hypothetical protein
MKKLSTFIKKSGVTAAIEEVGTNPNMDAGEEWMRTARHYKVLLKKDGRRMTLYFSQGSGIKGEPELSGILDCIASDSASVENSTFEEFCADLGYDTDSRRAERTYKVCQRQAEKLERLLGRDLYEDLLWNTERE